MVGAGIEDHAPAGKRGHCKPSHALVAQLEEALGSGPRGSGFESQLGHVSEEEEGIKFPFIIIEPDGTERQVSGDEARSFWQMIQDTSNYLTERDGGGAWKAAVAELNRTIPGLHLDHMGGYVPIQGDGTYQGEECYFRARHQHAAFSVGTYDKDPADWLKKIIVRIPGLYRTDPILPGMKPARGWREMVPWLKKIVKRVPGLRQPAKVSGWNAKRKAEAQVVPDNDPHRAGYLTPAQCIVILREVLIPNLRVRTRNEGKA